MQPKQQILNNGQELQTGDFNNVAAEAAMADDVVFSEFLRVPGHGFVCAGVVNGVFRGVMPWYQRGGSVQSSVCVNGILLPVPSTGGVALLPFRAVVGARDATPAGTALRDIRTVLYSPPDLSTPVPSAFAANSSVYPRWDLLYATVMIDANQTAVNRYIKDPSTKVVSSVPVVTQVASTMSFGIQPGTAASSPQFPAAPSDPIGGYIIPIAYVRIPSGFGPTSTILATDICELAVTMPSSVGEQNCSMSGVLSSGRVGAWGSTGTPPSAFIPSTMSVGEEKRIFAWDLLDSNPANWSISSGSSVDSTVDWRNRIFKVFATCRAGTPEFPWEASATSGTTTPDNSASGITYVALGSSMGTTGGTGTGGRIVLLNPSVLPQMNAGSSVEIDVSAATGVMSITVTGTPLVKMFVWIEATGQFPHRAP